MASVWVLAPGGWGKRVHQKALGGAHGRKIRPGWPVDGRDGEGRETLGEWAHAAGLGNCVYEETGHKCREAKIKGEGDTFC